MKLNLQTILLIVFGFFTLIGVAVFAGYIKIGGSSSKATPSGTATLWGTLDKRTMDAYLTNSASKDQTYKVSYTQKDPASYEQS